MNSGLRWLRFGTILLVALLTGLAFAHLLELPAKMAYPAGLYVQLQQTLYVQWGPPNIGGILEPSAILATCILAFFLRGRPVEFRFTLGAAIALLLAFPMVFFWLVAPANKEFLAASPLHIPANWEELRERWEVGHAIRFWLQFAALASLVYTVTFRERHGRSY